MLWQATIGRLSALGLETFGSVTMDSTEPGLPANPTMRDINDYCVKNNLPSLAQGMIELPPPEKLCRLVGETAKAASVHKYCDRFGAPEYRTAISSFLKVEYSIDATPENVLACQGVSGAIVGALSLAAKLSESRYGVVRKIGLVVPFYTYHKFQIEYCFGKDKIDYISSREDFGPDWTAISNSVSHGLSAVLFCNPGNPTGRVWAKEEVERLVELTSQHGCMLIVDECYCDLIWEGKQHYSAVNTAIREHVVVARGFSKILGCQSWRVGYCVSSASTVGQLMRIMDPIYICTPWLQYVIAQYLAEERTDFCHHKMKLQALMRDNWKKLSKALASAFNWTPIEPEGSMYGLFKHQSSSDMEATVLALKRGIGVCPGNIFYPSDTEHSGYIRIHCGISSAKTDRILEVLSSTQDIFVIQK